jgi:hypothetical protein
MSIRPIFAVSAAIVLSTAATASAATKKQKVPRSGPQAQAIAPRTAPPFNPPTWSFNVSAASAAQ